MFCYTEGVHFSWKRTYHILITFIHFFSHKFHFEIIVFIVIFRVIWLRSVFISFTKYAWPTLRGRKLSGQWGKWLTKKGKLDKKEMFTNYLKD